MVVQGLLPLATIYLAKLIIDTVTLNLSSLPILRRSLLEGVTTADSWQVQPRVVNSLSQSLNELVNTAHSQKVTDYMQGIIHAKSIEADLEYYENAKYHDALQRAQQEAPYRPPQILNRLAQLGQNAISLSSDVGAASILTLGNYRDSCWWQPFLRW